VFLKLYGNANLSCKKLFQQFKIRSTPSFLFFRAGVCCCRWARDDTYSCDDDDTSMKCAKALEYVDQGGRGRNLHCCTFSTLVRYNMQEARMIICA
jgi:hypothetical protein